MRILQIAPQVPYPLEDGGKVGIFNITKHLAERGHQITLVAFDRSPGTDYSEMKRHCRLLTVSHDTRTTYSGALRNLFSSLPYNIAKYQSKGLMRTVAGETEGKKYDIIHVDHLHMAGYGAVLREQDRLPVVLREHNVESVIMDRFTENSGNPFLRLYLGLQRARLRTYEAAMLGLFDCCCPITEVDAARISELNPDANVRVVPGGVDSSYFDGGAAEDVHPRSMVFFGGLDWIPNHDALLWFLREILPLVHARVPDAVLYIVGKKIPPEIRSYEGKDCVIRGFVPDLKNEIRKYAVSIAPFRIGGGMRLKIIESFAMGVPVVSTRVGCEGIDAEPGRHLIVGDTPAEFADGVTALLLDQGKRGRIIGDARRLAMEKYRWEKIAEEFESVYREVIAASGRRGEGNDR